MNDSGPPQDGALVGEFSVADREVTCQEFVELITDYFEGALTPRTLSQVEEHLVMCDWCVTYAGDKYATRSPRYGRSGHGRRLSHRRPRARHRRAADQLAACTTLDQLLATTGRLAEEIPDTRISLTIAGDGAVRALSGAPPTSAYIAAHAALRLDGPAGYTAERACSRAGSWSGSACA